MQQRIYTWRMQFLSMVKFDYVYKMGWSWQLADNTSAYTTALGDDHAGPTGVTIGAARYVSQKMTIGAIKWEPVKEPPQHFSDNIVANATWPGLEPDWWEVSYEYNFGPSFLGTDVPEVDITLSIMVVGTNVQSVTPPEGRHAMEFDFSPMLKDVLLAPVDIHTVNVGPFRAVHTIVVRAIGTLLDTYSPKCLVWLGGTGWQGFSVGGSCWIRTLGAVTASLDAVRVSTIPRVDALGDRLARLPNHKKNPRPET